MKTQNNRLLTLALALAALVLNLSAIQPARAADFVSTSPMTRARSYHTATLLPNGKVLVAGGSGDSATELFDPATETWTLTGGLRAYRGGHRATLLPNGKVLVEGASKGGKISFPARSCTIQPAAPGRPLVP